MRLRVIVPAGPKTECGLKIEIIERSGGYLLIPSDFRSQPVGEGDHSEDIRTSLSAGDSRRFIVRHSKQPRLAIRLIPHTASPEPEVFKQGCHTRMVLSVVKPGDIAATMLRGFIRDWRFSGFAPIMIEKRMYTNRPELSLQLHGVLVDFGHHLGRMCSSYER